MIFTEKLKTDFINTVTKLVTTNKHIFKISKIKIEAILQEMLKLNSAGINVTKAGKELKKALDLLKTDNYKNK